MQVWDPASAHSVSTFAEHTAMVYCAIWAPRRPLTFASVGADGMLKIWDCRQPGRSAQVHKPRLPY
jgi:WD40 repeat protein